MKPSVDPSGAPRVLVTGGAGYIGSHAVLRLLGSCHVEVLDNLSRGHLELVAPGVRLHCLDLRDRAAVLALLRERRYDVVMHFAAFAYVAESMTNPGLYFENNVTGSQNLLDAMTEAGVRRLVFSSSCTVYGHPPTLPIAESMPLAPVNAYGESKAAVERMLAWYGRAHGLRSVALRYFNAAGADAAGRAGEQHDPEPHLLPRLLAAASSGTPFPIFGDDYDTADGTCVRDYVHVTDLAEAHASAMDHLLRGGDSMAVNLGTGAGLSVRAMVECAQRVTGARIAVQVAPRRAGDPPALVADASRAAAALGWRPRHSSAETIIATAWAWHKRSSSRAAAAGVGPRVHV